MVGAYSRNRRSLLSVDDLGQLEIRYDLANTSILWLFALADGDGSDI